MKLDKPEFIGREALIKLKDDGIKRKISAFEMEDNSVPRNDYEIVSGGSSHIGKVTSGTFSPLLKKGIGLGMIDITHAIVGTKIFVKIRESLHSAKIVKKPFYKYTGRKY